MKLTDRAQMRRRAGLTQIRLSRLADVSTFKLSLWENHEIELSAKEINRIARALAAELSKFPLISGEREIANVLATSGVELACVNA